MASLYSVIVVFTNNGHNKLKYQNLRQLRLNQLRRKKVMLIKQQSLQHLLRNSSKLRKQRSKSKLKSSTIQILSSHIARNKFMTSLLLRALCSIKIVFQSKLTRKRTNLNLWHINGKKDLTDRISILPSLSPFQKSSHFQSKLHNGFTEKGTIVIEALTIRRLNKFTQK